VKLHGTNAAIGYSDRCGLWTQSRGRLITPVNDNMGFSAYVFRNKLSFTKLLKKIALLLNVDVTNGYVVLYGEYCGEKIQKNVAISKCERMFVAFDVVSCPSFDQSPDPSMGGNNINTWHDILSLKNEVNSVVCGKEGLPSFYHVAEFGVYSVSIPSSFDMTELQKVRVELERITDEVEKQCPAGAFFGITKDNSDCSTGEGVVWRFSAPVVNGENQVIQETHRFKVKGDDHATSKNQRGAALDFAVNNSFQEFIETVVSENRCRQAINEVFADAPCTKEWIKRIGNFQQWIVHDVKKEEMSSFPFLDDYNGVNGEEQQKAVTKDLNRALSKQSAEWFKSYLVENSTEKE
jgi:hypothetical protein